MVFGNEQRVGTCMLPIDQLHTLSKKGETEAYIDGLSVMFCTFLFSYGDCVSTCCIEVCLVNRVRYRIDCEGGMNLYIPDC
jgi:hypothetical protein